MKIICNYFLSFYLIPDFEQFIGVSIQFKVFLWSIRPENQRQLTEYSIPFSESKMNVDPYWKCGGCDTDPQYSLGYVDSSQ